MHEVQSDPMSGQNIIQTYGTPAQQQHIRLSHTEVGGMDWSGAAQPAIASVVGRVNLPRLMFTYSADAMVGDGCFAQVHRGQDENGQRCSASLPEILQAFW